MSTPAKTNGDTPVFRPSLLRETAEIALTEIKRFIEPRLAAEFSLRRVAAPLYLPVEVPGGNDLQFHMAGSNAPMAIVTGLDSWLRRQLDRYDIAPGFGVFTVMNALRPEIPETATSSPHVAAWAWQQAIDDPGDTSRKTLKHIAETQYAVFRETEKMILGKFPHMSASLPEALVTIGASEIIAASPADSAARSEYDYLKRRPGHAAYFIVDDTPGAAMHTRGRILVWNAPAACPLELAEIMLYAPGNDSPRHSVGCNIWRDRLAMQLLHQHSILKPI